MTPKQFSAKVGTIKQREFVLLDDPWMVQNFMTTKFAVFALAWAENQSRESYNYALAVQPVIGNGYRLVVLYQYGALSDDWWVEYNDRAGWVKEWFSKNPSKLVQGSMIAIRAKWKI